MLTRLSKNLRAILIAETLFVAIIAMPDIAAAQNPSPVIGILLAAGDIAKCSSDPTKQGRQKETGALIAQEIKQAPAGVPVRVLVLGDLAYDNGEPKSFSDCFDPAWGEFKDKMLPVPGNHEYRPKLPNGTFDKKNGKEHAKPYFEYFKENALVKQNGAEAGFYATNFPDETKGPWQIIGLNLYAGLGDGSPQLKFVRAAMEKAKDLPCVLAFSHAFRFSSGLHGHNDDEDALAAKLAEKKMRPVFHELYAHRASVFVAGHDHHFEQLGRANADGKVRDDGVRSFIVGTGGAGLYSIDYKNFWKFREAYDINNRGILKIELHTDSYSWAFISVEPSAGAMKINKNVTRDNCNRKKS